MTSGEQYAEFQLRVIPVTVHLKTRNAFTWDILGSTLHIIPAIHYYIH